ncbi:MAG: hypothetical protein RR614_13280 [Eubacterium sp.]
MGLASIYTHLVITKKRALHENDDGIVLVPELLQNDVWLEVNRSVKEEGIEPPEWPYFLSQ